jgi:cation diffusion facilitator CzcD-associated flavoprotein CzcO
MKSSTQPSCLDDSPRDVQYLDVVIVGAGFSGLYMLHKLRALELDVKVFDAASGVGGTWFWNCYPGARCDVQSVEYSYRFSDELQQEWNWTERYASQPEILRYLNHVADRFELRRDIQLDTNVVSVHFNDASGDWSVSTSDGTVVRSRFIVMATGALSKPFIPSFPGRDRFRGLSVHTGQWPQDGVDVSGKRVGVIGTGSSGVQCVPIIAQSAEHLTLFQRTPTYSAPAGNHPLTEEALAKIKADYAGLRERNDATMGGYGADHPIDAESALSVSAEDMQRRYEYRWNDVGGLLFLGAYEDLLTNPEANKTAADFIRAKIRTIVSDPSVADRLMPSTLVGCKRLCTDTDYYQTFNRPNVSLVDVSSAPIEEITESGIRTSAGNFELDVIVYATGFDAMTGALTNIDVKGRNGLALREKWREGPINYLGVGTAGFPNLFTVVGPGNPSVLTNMVASIEHHVEWISGCIDHMNNEGLTSIEVTPDAERDWVDQVNALAEPTIFPTCNSWYLGANIPGKPRVFMPYLGLPPYREKCADVAAGGYEGFALA